MKLKLFYLLAAAAVLMAAGCGTGAETRPQYNITVTAGSGGTATASATSAEKGTRITITATPNSGQMFVKWSATGFEFVDPADETENPLTFTMPAADVSFEAEFAKGENGVLINGVTWATRNVDAPGTFAESEEFTGMFYQWNRRVGWSSTDPLVSTDGQTEWNMNWELPTVDSWAPENDPCPTGWRVPTDAEFRKLCDTGKVTASWTPRIGEFASGLWFTDKTSGNKIFFPAAGSRENGSLNWVDIMGAYWGAEWYKGNPDADAFSTAMWFRSNGTTVMYDIQVLGYCVRCVKVE